MKIKALIAAAGSSSRYGKQKLLEDLNGKTVIERTIETFEKNDLIDEIIICTSADIIDEIKELSAKHDKVSQVILGGKTRQESVYAGLKSLKNCDFVAIHDGARPLVSDEVISNTINKALEHHHATCAVKVKDTIKKVEGDKIISTPNRDKLYQIQTPQVFEYDDILKAHEKYKNQNFTDDTALIEKMGEEVFIVKGCYKNLKITTAEDIEIARVLDFKNLKNN